MTPSGLATITGIMALSLLLQIYCSYRSNIDIWLTSFDLTRHLRLHLLEHLQRLPMKFHLQQSRGTLLSALTDDINLLETVLTEGLPRAIQALVLPLILLAWLCWHDPLLALAASLSVIAALPFLLWANGRMLKLGGVRQQRQVDAADAMVDYMLGLPVARSCNQDRDTTSRLHGRIAEFRNISVRMVKHLTPPLVGFAAILLSGVAVTLYAMSWRIGDPPAAEVFLLFLLFLFALYVPLLALTGVLELTRSADASMTRTLSILAAAAEARPGTGPRPTSHAVTLSGVDFGYDDPTKQVVRDVSLHAPDGRVTAIVGPSGSGKSTLLNLALGFWTPAKGTVSIGGIDLRQLAGSEVHRMMSIVQQDVYLFDGTVAENIALSRPGAGQDAVEAAARSAQIHDHIRALPDGYETRIGEVGSMFSGGERQRIAIARAILKDAPILLLDEFTSAIDPTSERRILDALFQAMRDKTVIVVTHRMAIVERAHGVVFIQNGVVRAQGTHGDLLQTPDYSAHWDAVLSPRPDAP